MKLICRITISIGLLSSIIKVGAQSGNNMGNGEKSEHAFTIEFNKNIEFLGYTLYMGEPDDNVSQAAKNHPLRLSLEEKREQLSDEESLLKIFDLAAELSYSLFVELFLKLYELPYQGALKIPDDVARSYNLNTPADIALMQKIMEQVNIFYAVSGFEEFWESAKPWYTKAMEEINKAKPDDAVIEVMEDFYEQKFASYKIVPSLTLWSGPGFGIKKEEKNATTAYFVLGPLTDDYHFNLNDRLKTLAIHEFGHSFVNHVLDATCRDLIDETRTLFDTVAQAMNPQGYNRWESCIDEHFVRAGEVLIPELMGNAAMSEANLKWNVEEKKFIYLPFIVEQLRKYRIKEGLSYELAIRNTMLDVKKTYNL